jgi:hypothetical protein
VYNFLKDDDFVCGLYRGHVWGHLVGLLPFGVILLIAGHPVLGWIGITLWTAVLVACCVTGFFGNRSSSKVH